jgi:hypothetical protein
MAKTHDIWADPKDVGKRTVAVRREPKPAHIPADWVFLGVKPLTEKQIKDGEF